MRTMDRMPPPAPARAWATLSFWGITGLDAAGAMVVVRELLWWPTGLWEGGSILE